MTTGWLVEYSPSQRAFHIQTAEEAARENFRLILFGRTAPDYIPLYFTETRREAAEAAVAIRQILDERRG